MSKYLTLYVQNVRWLLNDERNLLSTGVWVFLFKSLLVVTMQSTVMLSVHSSAEHSIAKRCEDIVLLQDSDEILSRNF